MNDGNKITIVIPCKEHDGIVDPATITLDSLAKQTFKDFKVVVVPDQGKGANWARNEGFKQCDTEFVLFSDNDIQWKENALEVMVQTLRRFTRASYAYGRFHLVHSKGFTVWGHQHFDPVRLLVGNFVSTMSLIRAKDFPGFDESLKRYQDWDLWITMLKQGKRGVYCNELIFTTDWREGISTFGGVSGATEAARIINDKHGLNLPVFNNGYL